MHASHVVSLLLQRFVFTWRGGVTTRGAIIGLGSIILPVVLQHKKTNTYVAVFLKWKTSQNHRSQSEDMDLWNRQHCAYVTFAELWPLWPLVTLMALVSWGVVAFIYRQPKLYTYCTATLTASYGWLHLTVTPSHIHTHSLALSVCLSWPQTPDALAKLRTQPTHLVIP